MEVKQGSLLDPRGRVWIRSETMLAYRPKHIYVETRIRQAPLAGRILRSLSGCSVHEIRDHRRLEDECVPLKGYDANIKGGVLVLAHHPGPCIRPFPGSREDSAPTEFYVAHANGCPFDCQYCFLQGYFDHGARIVVLSQGMAGRLQVDPGTLEKLKQLDVQVHVLPSDEAVRVYNRLRESEAVGALIHSTC